MPRGYRATFPQPRSQKVPSNHSRGSEKVVIPKERNTHSISPTYSSVKAAWTVEVMMIDLCQATLPSPSSRRRAKPALRQCVQFDTSGLNPQASDAVSFLGRDPDRSTLLVERYVADIVDFEHGALGVVNVYQPLLERIVSVQPPYISYQTILAANSRTKKMNVEHRRRTQGQIVPRPKEIPPVEKGLPRVVSHQIIGNDQSRTSDRGHGQRQQKAEHCHWGEGQRGKRYYAIAFGNILCHIARLPSSSTRWMPPITLCFLISWSIREESDIGENEGNIEKNIDGETVSCLPSTFVSKRHGFDSRSIVILGRAIKSEYLALGTIFSTIGVASLFTGGKKAEPIPAPGKSIIETVKEAVPINAGSRVDSIRKYIAEAEKEAKH
ncbi:hypothetical protein IMY05_C4485000400 [Salix suchowensis]|nr:hypothetical protein IMY05_C4485000400 [Salix suchowensis]